MDGSIKSLRASEADNIDIDAFFDKAFDLKDVPTNSKVEGVLETVIQDRNLLIATVQGKELANSTKFNPEIAEVLGFRIPTEAEMNGILDRVALAQNLISPLQKSANESDQNFAKSKTLDLTTKEEYFNKVERQVLKVISGLIKANEEDEAEITDQIGEILVLKVRAFIQKVKALSTVGPDGVVDELGIISFEGVFIELCKEIKSLLPTDSEALDFIIVPLKGMQAEMAASLNLNVMSLETLEERLTNQLTSENFPEAFSKLIETNQALIEEITSIISMIESDIEIHTIEYLIKILNTSIQNFKERIRYLCEGNKNVPELINRFIDEAQSRIDRAFQIRINAKKDWKLTRKESYIRVTERFRGANRLKRTKSLEI